MIGEKLIPVYRQQQRTITSSCVLGRLCRICQIHALCVAGELCRDCRRAIPYVCERARPAEPAFYLKPVQAITLVKNSLARFVNQNSGIQLTFSRVEQMRGESCNVEERLISLYIAGLERARVAIDVGWSSPPESEEKACSDDPLYPFV